MPLMVGYASYSLLQLKFKSWYSWILSSLVGFIYMFGFVMMTPQVRKRVSYVASLPPIPLPFLTPLSLVAALYQLQTPERRPLELEDHDLQVAQHVRR